MAAYKIMQGDEYPITVSLSQDGQVLIPDMVADLEITVADKLRYLFSRSTIGFDTAQNLWWFRPTQKETISLEPDGCAVIARVKYYGNIDFDVKGIPLGTLIVSAGNSKEVI